VDKQRIRTVLGGELEALWDYDQDEEEWSDEYRRRRT
jgi:hypothetical protein